jgi:hypothetical protein
MDARHVAVKKKRLVAIADRILNLQVIVIVQDLLPLDRVARGFALLSLPKMPELKGVNVPFEPFPIDASKCVPPLNMTEPWCGLVVWGMPIRASFATGFHLLCMTRLFVVCAFADNKRSTAQNPLP